MATHAFRIINVFTHNRSALTGNPLCVFENGAEFDTERMQALALQFNLSETTFILPSSQADARVRIFTPAYEPRHHQYRLGLIGRLMIDDGMGPVNDRLQARRYHGKGLGKIDPTRFMVLGHA
jgi:hypothetical protein